jgi:hypothetical protein
MSKDYNDFIAKENANLDMRLFISQMETMNMILFLTVLKTFQMKAYRKKQLL